MSERSEGRRTLTRRSRTVLHVLMALCVAGIVVFAWLLISSSQEYSRGGDTYEHIRAEIFPVKPMTGTEAGRNAVEDAAGSGDEKGSAGEKGLGDEKDSDRVGSEGAPPQAPSPSVLDFLALQRLNPDIVGWIVGGETIDYPIVQGDDNDYYLSHLVNHERNKVGSIFMDYRNQGDFSDRATVIYGHNMKNGSMFAPLAKYKSQSYYDRFPTMELYTPDGDHTLQLFAGMVVDGDDGPLYLDFTDWGGPEGHIDGLRRASTFRSDTVVGSGDRIVILSTCSYESGNARYVVFGRLAPVGWSEKQTGLHH